MSFALFLAKNVDLSFSPLNSVQFTLSVAKNVVLFKTVCILRTVKWLGRGIETAKQAIEFPAEPFFFSSKKWIKLIPKTIETIGNRKRDCAWGCTRGINTTGENLQNEKHKSVQWAERTPSWFVLFDLQIFSGGVYPRVQPHAQSLFLFAIVFGINFVSEQKKLNWVVPE